MSADPTKLSNDDLALTLELWVMLNEQEFTDSQMNYFNEIVWRLKLMADKEQEANEQGK